MAGRYIEPREPSLRNAPPEADETWQAWVRRQQNPTKPRSKPLRYKKAPADLLSAEATVQTLEGTN